MSISKPMSVGALYVVGGVIAFVVIELLALSLLHRDMSVGASAAIMAIMVMAASRAGYNAGKNDRGAAVTRDMKQEPANHC